MPQDSRCKRIVCRQYLRHQIIECRNGVNNGIMLGGMNDGEVPPKRVFFSFFK
jgi:hypothetical protein